MSKIERLTKEQEEYLPVFRQKYLDAACNGKRIDRDKLQVAINAAYAEIDKAAPLLIILQSPLQAMMAIKFMQEFAKGDLGDSLYKIIYDKLDDQLGGQLWDQLGGQRIYNSGYLWGSQDLYWIARAKFAQHIGVKFTEDQTRQLNIMHDIGFQCEWWWPFEGVCFVSETPTEVKWDGNVLHNETGPAVLYEDGYTVYSWRGTNIPREWIEEKDKLPPERALTWDNVEQRRAACEILGWQNVLEHPSLNPKIIDEDQPHIGTLIQVDLPDAPEQWFIKYKCGTGRWFAEAVNDKSFDTALKANAGGNGWRQGGGLGGIQ